MRVLIETLTPTKRIMKDRSPMGVPRWVIEEIDSEGRYRTVRIYNKIWYKLEKVKELESCLNT